MTQIVLNRPEHLRRLDDIVESFETAWIGGYAELREYLEGLRSDDDRQIATELLCIDLHYRWPTESRKTVNTYLKEFPDILSHSNSLLELAREEFRIRRDSGESVLAAKYREEYGVDTRDWLSDETETVTHAGSQTELNDLGGELVRLTDAIQTFPVPGDTVGDFELVEELGRGTFGVVFLARQGELHERLVALKITTVTDIESRHLARLQHTHIVPIYSIHHFGDLQGICMPFLGRRTLAQLIASRRDEKFGESNGNREISESEVVQLALQIASGLRHAHERGISHRDLKPENVLVNDDGDAMLLDFNLSHDVVSGGRTSLMVGGTLPYLAPEHLRAVKSGTVVHPESDIFSLGVMLHQLISTELPFEIRTGSFDLVIDQMIRDRCAKETPTLNRPGISCSPGLASVVAKMLLPEIANRYASISDVCEDLQRHQANLPLKHAPNVSVGERISKWRMRHPRLSSTATATFFFVMIVGTLLVALVLRGNRIARQAAEAQLSDVRNRIPELRALVSMPIVDDISLTNGYTLALGIAETYDVFDPNWRDQPGYAALSEADRQELHELLTQSVSLLASSAARRSTVPMTDGEKQELDKIAGSAKQWAEQFGARSDGAQNGFGEVIQNLREFRFDEAIPKLEALRDSAPYDIYTWRLLGNAYAAVGRLSEAEGCFTICVSMWPDSHWGYVHRGLCRLDMGKYPEAVVDFTAALKRRKEYIPALIDRGVAHRELKNYRAALSDFDRAIDLGATQTRIYFLRSEIRSKLGDATGAAADQTTGLRTTPTDEQSWIKRGLVLLKSDVEAALSDFNEALAINPKSRAALRNIAHVYAERQQRWEESLELMNRLIKLYNNHLDDVVSRGVLLARLGRREEALEDARTVLSRNASPKQLFQVGCIYSMTSKTNPNDADIALSLIDRAILQDPKWLKVAVTDPDLNAVRTKKEFALIVRSATHRLDRAQRAKKAMQFQTD